MENKLNTLKNNCDASEKFGYPLIKRIKWPHINFNKNI